MEKVPQPPTTLETKLLTLSSEISSGAISPSTFLDEVLKLDQSDPERTSAPYAAELLSQPDIVAMLETSEAREHFYSVRSLMYFHKAQIQLAQGNNDVQADLQRALQDAETLGTDYADSVNYIRATIAYLDGDLELLRALSEKEKLNKSLVRNFITGLETRGHPDYPTDYAKERADD